jgi:putative ABC transport system permease protein
MIWNYIKTALRVIKRQKLFSVLNIAGLALSLTCSLLIFLHIKDELSYESGFPKADRIYRVQVNSKYGSNFRNWAGSAPALGPILEESFPEIQSATRLRPMGTQIISLTSPQGTTRRFEESWGFFADSSVFSMFDLRFSAGDPLTALNEPHAAVLTSSMAERLFGENDPMNQILMNETEDQPLLVKGIIQDFPSNTHLKIDYLVSMPTFGIYLGIEELFNHRTWKTMYTYVLLSSPNEVTSFDTKSPRFMQDYHAGNPDRVESLVLQPIGRIHLHSKLEGELRSNSDIAYVYIFSGAALLILLIAGVNFVNLSTAQSFKRMKEIGIRKVIGAKKNQLIKQFLGESFLLTVMASGLGLILFNMSIPFYNQITGKALTFKDLLITENILFLLILVGLLSILAGLYPAFFVSGFQPVSTIKSAKDPRSFATRLRQALVIFQFVISIFMIFGTITIFRQLVFFQNRDLGFDKDQLLAVRLYPAQRQEIFKSADAVKAEIRSHSAVTHVALASNLPGSSLSNERLTPVSVTDRGTMPMLRFMRVDEDYIKTAGLELIAGRDFDPASDQQSAYIISESVAAVLDLEQPLGIQCRSDIHDGTAPIVGVIKDFHFASLHKSIEPLVLEYRPQWTGLLLVKVRAGRFSDVLSFLEQKLDKIAPDQLFRYYFVDQYFDRNYEMERRGSRLFRIFSVLAILVACLGLFGLTVYAAEVRVKEIGIRKVLGASFSHITVLMTKEFILWILIANALAWPLAYFAMNKWLENFAYRTNINLGTFVITASLSLVFALITVSYQALKTATANPVNSLRYE